MRPDQRAGERNCGDTNEPTTDDDAPTIVGLDDKVDDWSDMEDNNFKMQKFILGSIRIKTSKDKLLLTKVH
ncbi:hypothetical protein MRX96_045272 [Rhipicephalus microplus]